MSNCFPGACAIASAPARSPIPQGIAPFNIHFFLEWQHYCISYSMEHTNDTRRTVLIVDDDEDLLILVQHALAAEGYEPICSPNGVNVMAIVARKHPDIVLLDIHMNGTDGATICRELKLNPETS